MTEDVLANFCLEYILCSVYRAVIKIVRCIWFNESIIKRKITLKVIIFVDSRVIFLCLKVGNNAKQCHKPSHRLTQKQHFLYFFYWITL